ncbi:hypothetical protein DL767_001394 [Monosporascus sp. MG133]|nr:hypothetical protein DL767_001394 [Monosporascus sp. MG133]
MGKFNPHFLVISLGNPGRYYETMHSAGHLALLSLQKAIKNGADASGASSPGQPDFSPYKRWKKTCQASTGPKYTLLQSPTLMNVSGDFVRWAWNETLKGHGVPPSDLGLVVLHDELETRFGVVRTRQWGTSHRGHNGIKSIYQKLQIKDYPGARWARISVGIDRPESRDPADVADYVLSRLTDQQKEAMDTEVGSRVLESLNQLEALWRQQHEKDTPKDAT